MNTKPYISPSSGEPCTAPQYIAEILITRQEAADNNPVPYKFWGLPKYKKRYVRQLVWVNALLKVHKPHVIIAALMSKRGRSIYSTASKFLANLIQAEEAKDKRLKADLDKVVETVRKNPIPMKLFGKKNVLSKLRELDGRKKEEGEDEAIYCGAVHGSPLDGEMYGLVFIIMPYYAVRTIFRITITNHRVINEFYTLQIWSSPLHYL